MGKNAINYDVRFSVMIVRFTCNSFILFQKKLSIPHFLIINN